MLQRNLLITLAFSAVIYFLSGLWDSGMRLDPGQEALAVVMPDATIVALRYDEIETTEYLEGIDYGECINGQKRRACWYGSWRNALWGDYRLCIHPGVNACIAIHAASGTFAFNGSSVRDTQSLAQTLEARTSKAAGDDDAPAA